MKPKEIRNAKCEPYKSRTPESEPPTATNDFLWRADVPLVWCLIEFAARIAIPNRRTSPRARPYLRPAPQWTFVTLTVCAQVSALLIKLSLNCVYCIVGHRPVRIHAAGWSSDSSNQASIFLPIGQPSKYLHNNLYLSAVISGIITRSEVAYWERPLRIHNGSLSLITRASYLGLISLDFSSMATQEIETVDKNSDFFRFLFLRGYYLYYLENIAVF